MIRIYIFIIIVISLFSCQKASDCFSSSGKEIVVEQALANFDSLYVNDVFDIELIQDTINKICIKGKEAFVNSTYFNIENNTLILNNSHKCKFAKPKNNSVLINLHVKRISFIRLNASSKVFSNNTLFNYESIGLVATSKYNEADLNVNCDVFYYWNNHLNGGRINIKGQADIIKLWNVSLASVDASNLYVRKALVENSSKGYCKVNVSEILNCKIKGTGNVYCIGNPGEVNYVDSASIGGRLIFDGQ